MPTGTYPTTIKAFLMKIPITAAKTYTTLLLGMANERNRASQGGSNSVVYSSLWLESYPGSTFHCHSLTYACMHVYSVYIKCEHISLSFVCICTYENIEIALY